MAIQMRRGHFEKFDPTKLLPGEFAVVLQGDDANRYGKGIYMCFASGDVQRISTIEDISENILQANDVLIGSINDELRAEFSEGEDGRAAAEAARAAAESLRSAAEGRRVEAESGRAEAESARVAAEADRAEGQAANDLAQAKNNADQLANNASALHARFTRLGEGEYDPETGVPTIAEPVNGVIYLVPSPDGDGPNTYVEWFWATNDAMTEGTWEAFGDPSAIPDPVTTDDVDAAFDAVQATGVRYMALSSMNYLAAKIKALFAPLVHKHKGTDIDAATLPRTAIDASFESDIASLEESWDSVSQKYRLGSKMTGDGAYVSFHATNESTASGRQMGMTFQFDDEQRNLFYFDYDLGLVYYDATAAERVYLLPRKRILYSGSRSAASGYTISIEKPSWLAKCNRLMVCGYIGTGGNRFSVDVTLGNMNFTAVGIDSGSTLIATRVNVNTNGDNVVIANSGVANIGAPTLYVTQIYAYKD